MNMCAILFESVSLFWFLGSRGAVEFLHFFDVKIRREIEKCTKRDIDIVELLDELWLHGVMVAGHRHAIWEWRWTGTSVAVAPTGIKQSEPHAGATLLHTVISHPPWTRCLSMIERNLWMFSCVFWFVYVMLRTGTEVHNVLLAFTYLPIVWDIWITCVFAVLEFFCSWGFYLHHVREPLQLSSSWHRFYWHRTADWNPQFGRSESQLRRGCVGAWLET